MISAPIITRDKSTKENFKYITGSSTARCAATRAVGLILPTLSYRPYCSNNFGEGMYIRSQEQALKYRNIQFNNPTAKALMVMDIDKDMGAFAWEDRGLASPNFATINPENGHAHLVWLLETPVLATNAAKTRPLNYFNAIRQAYALQSGADLGYVGLVTKNPLHHDWLTLYNHSHEYGLGELVEYLPHKLSDYTKEYDRCVKPANEVGVGRNMLLFNTVRQWAYREVRLYRTGRRSSLFDVWYRQVLDYVEKRNGDFVHPLSFGEVKAISKSIAKYCWRYDVDAEQKFLERQSQRGRLGGLAGGRGRSSKDLEKRQRALIMIAEGMTQQATADAFGVSSRTIRRWLNL